MALLAFIDALWQLYLVYLLMAVGAATMHVGAISNVVGLWFDQQAPLAISLALNGASSGGILITPLLVLAIAHYGFSDAIVGAAAAHGRGAAAGDRAVDRPPGGRGSAARRRAGSRPPGRRRSALRSCRFWSVAAPFALALTAQVGFLVHQIAILEPRHGPRAGRLFGGGADGHGDHRTLRARRIRRPPRHAAVRGMVAGEPGRGAAGDDGDDRHRRADRWPAWCSASRPETC